MLNRQKYEFYLDFVHCGYSAIRIRLRPQPPPAGHPLVLSPSVQPFVVFDDEPLSHASSASLPRIGEKGAGVLSCAAMTTPSAFARRTICQIAYEELKPEIKAPVDAPVAIDFRFRNFADRRPWPDVFGDAFTLALQHDFTLELSHRSNYVEDMATG